MYRTLLSYGMCAVLLFASVALAAYAGDGLTMAILLVMIAIVLAALLVGILPMIGCTTALNTGISSIRRCQTGEAVNIWPTIVQMDGFFRHKYLDKLFDEYKKKAETERANGMIVSDVEDVINEDVLALKLWHTNMLQIPNTFTGLGLLGTFLGLITGISGIQVSSVEATLGSIQQLLEGIRMAFYTSIAGVILSILFNTIYKMLWHIMLRDLGMFMVCFHRNVVPPVNEQEHYAQTKNVSLILDRLKSLPRLQEYMAANSQQAAQTSGQNEAILMPQVLQGMKNKEFIIYLQPRYDINTQRIIGAETLARWNHPKLGMLSPAVFIPVLESNGYITKLDQYLWELACEKLHEWLLNGRTPVPICINISKTDVMASNVIDFIEGMTQRYELPPRYLEIDIAQNCYLDAPELTLELEKAMRQMGFRVVIDGFTGDFYKLRSSSYSSAADAYKLDLRFCQEDEQLRALLSKARDLQIPMIVGGLENTRQLSILHKNGVTEAQGYLLCKPISIKKFEKKMGWHDA